MDSHFCFEKVKGHSFLSFLVLVFVSIGFVLSGQTKIVKFQTGEKNSFLNFCLDGNENPYLVFSNKHPSQPEKVFLAKLNAQLEFEWSRLLSFDSLGITAKNIVPLPNGNVMVLAEDYWEDENFGGTNILLTEFDQNGNFLTATRIGSEKFEELISAIVMPDGRVVFTGNVQSKTN